MYACSLMRALYLELKKTMSVEEFLVTFKRLIARKGRPEKVYSDHGKTVVAAAKWVRQVMLDERDNDFLAKMNIKWQFNFSRSVVGWSVRVNGWARETISLQVHWKWVPHMGRAPRCHPRYRSRTQ